MGNITNKPTDKWKICRTCEENAPHPWYNINGYKRGGFHASYCRRCCNKRRRDRERRSGHTSGFANLRARKTQRRITMKRKCMDLLGGECESCGMDDECTSLFDFHHTEAKSKIQRQDNKPNDIQRRALGIDKGRTCQMYTIMFQLPQTRTFSE